MPVDTVTELRPLMARAYGINLKAMHIANLTSLTSADLSLAQTGQRALTYIQFKEVENLVKDCEALVAQSGVPINFRDTVSVKKLLEAYRERQARPGIIEAGDWDLMRRTCSGEPASEIASSMGISMAELVEKLDIANSRFGQTVAELRRGNNERREFTNQQISEVESRR
jgi:hypothetical protein